MQFSAFEILKILIFELAGWKVISLERYGISKTPFIMESWGELLKFRKHLLVRFLYFRDSNFAFKHAPKSRKHTCKDIYSICIYIYIYIRISQSLMLSNLPVRPETLPECHVPWWYIQVEGFDTNNLMFIGAPWDFTIYLLLNVFGLEVCSMMSFWVYSTEARCWECFFFSRGFAVSLFEWFETFHFTKTMAIPHAFVLSKGVI